MNFCSFVRRLLILLSIFLLSHVAFAQQEDSNPSDLSLKLETLDGQDNYKLGQPINVGLVFSSATEERYFFVQQSTRLEGGAPPTVSCEPSSSVRDLWNERPGLDISRFLEAGDACKVGVGGGSGGGCYDCDGEVKLGKEPVRLGEELNRRIKFLKPGNYECTATAATVTEDPHRAKTRHAIPLVSKPLSLELTENPRWAALTTATDVAEIEELHCGGFQNPPGNDVSKDPASVYRCARLIGSLGFLDAEDAVREAARLYTGVFTQRLSSQLWQVIAQSEHRDLAVQLMEKKLLQKDFAVSQMVLGWLATAALRRENPNAFGPDVDPGVYHDQAIEVLRKYVRTLGRALPDKRGVALTNSGDTYANYAYQEFCQPERLIPEGETNDVLTAAGLPPQ